VLTTSLVLEWQPVTHLRTAWSDTLGSRLRLRRLLPPPAMAAACSRVSHRIRVRRHVLTMANKS